MTYIPQHFAPHELVPPDLYGELNGDPVKISRLFDDRLLLTLDRLRVRYGPVTVNNWLWNGDRTESGLRNPRTSTGALWSDHKFGRAIDCLFKKATVEQVRRDILADPHCPDFKFITCLEMTVAGKPITWLHFATRNWDKAKNGILLLHL